MHVFLHEYMSHVWGYLRRPEEVTSPPGVGVMGSHESLRGVLGTKLGFFGRLATALNY